MTMHTKNCKSLKHAVANSHVSVLKKLHQTPKRKRRPFNPDNLKRQLLKCAAENNWSLHSVTSSSVKELCEFMRPEHKVIVNRHNLRSKLDEEAAKSKEDLKLQLQACDSEISLAIDCWTPKQCRTAFLGIFPYVCFC